MTDTLEGQRDFFVSFNQADRTWATWIAWVIEAAGYSVFFQDWDFKGNFVLEMDRAHTRSRRTIAVLSPDYLASRFTAPEWAARFAQDATSQHDQLIPVRVRPCELEGLLAQIVYTDLVGCEEGAAKKRLLERVRGIRTKPDEPPLFPSSTARHTAVPKRPNFQWERSQLPSRVRGWRTRFREWLVATAFARRYVKRYLRNLVAQHREFTFLGRARPLNLQNIYVHLKVGEYTPRALRPDERAAPSANESDTPILAGQLVEIPAALSLSRRLAILGDPGSGKTTLLKYLVMQIAQRDPRLEPFARALIPRLSVRLLERVCRFLSGVRILAFVVAPNLIAVVVWGVQSLRSDMTYDALLGTLFLLMAMLIAMILTIPKVNSYITIFSGVLGLGHWPTPGGGNRTCLGSLAKDVPA